MRVSPYLFRAGWPVAPFLGIAVLAFAASGLRTARTNLGLVAGVAVGAAGVALVGFALPWSRLPPAALLVLPIAGDALIGLLREAQGGSTSGYAPLAILPVAWVGLTQGRRAVAAISGCTAVLFALPIVIVGAPMYPATGWRSVVLWTIVAAVLGVGANRVIDDRRRRTDGFAKLVETQTAIAGADTDLERLMTTAAEGALTLTGADGACIELLDGDEVVCSAAAGVAVEYLGLRLKAQETITGECFRTRRLLICSDSEDDTHAHRDACRLVGARSLIVVPLLDADEVKGVLLVWSAAAHDFQGYESQQLAVLANMVGAAFVRAELVDKLTSQAVTDELTGLTNRREWYHQLNQALARARRSGQPLSILILDLDRFKEINDRQGHAAGDRLLKTAASRWADALRTTDLLGRTGGDEFAIILELTDEDGAHEVINRLNHALAGLHHASTGLAVWDGHETADALIARADTAMYNHKRTLPAPGRQRPSLQTMTHDGRP